MTVMTDSNGTEKDGGLGADGTIPPHLTGVAATLGDEGSNFNHEEDPESGSSDAAVDLTGETVTDDDGAAGPEAGRPAGSPS